MALRVHLEGRRIALRCPAGAARRPYLNLQLLREPREDFTPCLCDDNHVFLARAAYTRVVQTWFDCEHLPVLQNDFLQARMFVDFKTETMASTVEKSDAPAFAHFGRETATGEEFLNGFVNRHAVNAGLDSLSVSYTHLRAHETDS